MEPQPGTSVASDEAESTNSPSAEGKCRAPGAGTLEYHRGNMVQSVLIVAGCYFRNRWFIRGNAFVCVRAAAAPVCYLCPDTETLCTSLVAFCSSLSVTVVKGVVEKSQCSFKAPVTVIIIMLKGHLSGLFNCTTALQIMYQRL